MTPVIGLFIVIMTKRNAAKQAETANELVFVKGEIRELGVAVDGKLKALVEATGAQKFLEGQNAGRASEKAEQALARGPAPIPVTLAETPVPVIVQKEEK